VAVFGIPDHRRISKFQGISGRLENKSTPRNQWNHKVRGAEIQAPLLNVRVLLDGCTLGHRDHIVRL
jgi:hypothetical protein